ncbi:MAG TPA: LptF/LptG family permease [Paludibacter sp.]|nr:LptF/LptG family permease [Paludibacter sp.]
MFRIKKIDLYVFKRFFTLFLMTFLICIFILLMQFLWKHVSELIGKGIGWSVLAEFFIYAVFSIVPMALPLAILLASLMTFGNLGETFELTAMKAAGISLFRIMRPLILFISLVCVGAFYFSNYVLPVAQTKLWTLVLSLRQKSPEFDIPVGEFYSGIPGVNIYVREKEKHLLKDLMIYDFSGGFENATVTVSDSGRVQFTKDNKYILLSLYDGESFSNLNNQRISSSSSSIPYRRETFKTKDILMDFDTEFTRVDESVLRDQNLSKNLKQLTHSIDSVSKTVAIQSNIQAKALVNQHFFGRDVVSGSLLNDSLKKRTKTTNIDSLFLALPQNSMVRVSDIALEKAKTMKELVEYNKMMLKDPTSYVTRHKIERHRKFTLSFACLIFFFIGAPLGAIIRKGGLGMPVVISVIMFIIYYIIENTGYKMVKEGLWLPFEGMWLSSFILLPIGIFLTYKAVVDAAILNINKYIKMWNLIKNKFNSTVNKLKLID